MSAGSGSVRSMSSSNRHRPLNAPIVMSNSPFDRREISIARSITA
jgi:hypothetical protein